MKPRKGTIVGLLFLAACSGYFTDQRVPAPESSARALGTVPPTEVAVWRRVSTTIAPAGRHLQAVAFDESRRVVVMFGGMTMDANTGSYSASGETWEWSPKTAKWTNRTGTGPAPEARSGAGMVFDSARGKLILFGGRAKSGFDFEDTWEWEPATATWTNVSAAGGHPSARSQHGMVYEKGKGKLLLFGGGRSDMASADGTGVAASLGDTWEYDPARYAWKQVTVTTAPTARHGFGLVWDAARSKAVLFGGLETETAESAGAPKQDTWEWDAATSTWTLRTTPGNQPSQRAGHAMAFDGKRGKVLVFGGLDVGKGEALADLWELDPATFTWSEQSIDSTHGMPAPLTYASLVSDDTSGRLELLAGLSVLGTSGSNLVWEMDPVKLAFSNRSSPLDLPCPRVAQTMTHSPATGKTYLYGGYDAVSGVALDDLWEWDGKVWTMVAVDSRPPARYDAGLAYDPARKSLILFGGIDGYWGGQIDETWEFDGDRKWTQLKPARSPEPLAGMAMVTDTARGKILLFGGTGSGGWDASGIYRDPLRNEVWEWDGVALTWTNRTPPSFINAPSARTMPLLTYDEGRQKLFLFHDMSAPVDGAGFMEWDPITGTWTSRDPGDSVFSSYYVYVAYDSIRRRQILLTDTTRSLPEGQSTWEIDTRGPTLYVRSTAAAPGGAYGASMVFDSTRGVVVLHGGQELYASMYINDTWEYNVTSLANGAGCTPALASTCASGLCIEGVCCAVAACAGACKSCSVAGAEGTCVLAQPGSEVPGSCADGMACDAAGACKAKNGQACAAAADCASGLCVDGVCCDSACAGTCTSCNQPGRAGKCTPYAVGTDPQNECGKGTGVCRSVCDGVGACVFPGPTVYCADCRLCNGSGECSFPDFGCGSGGSGGSGGNFGGSGGTSRPVGGSGGYVPNTGGSGGGTPSFGGADGGIPVVGGAGGVVPAGGAVDGGTSTSGGSGGGTSSFGGATGSTPSSGGAAGSFPTIDGGAGNLPGPGGSRGARDGAASDAGRASMHQSGCACATGGSRRFADDLRALLLFAGGTILALRHRRRRSKTGMPHGN